MLNKQEIDAGDHTSIIQGGRDVTLHQHNGLSYSEAKEVALDVYRSNFLQLSGEAADLASKRVEEFTEQLIKRMQRESQQLLNSMKDPDMQYALFTAQKAYARTGDIQLSEMLVNVLKERSKEAERTTYQLVLNECVAVLDKITNEQLDILSLSFILMGTRKKLYLYKDEVVDYIKSDILRFTEYISDNETNFKHLVYAGCSSRTTGGYILDKTLLNNYPGMFSKGFTLEEFQEITTNETDQNLITPHLIEEGNYQLIASYPELLEELFNELQTDHSIRPAIIGLQMKSKINDNEVRPFLIKLVPEVSNLFNLWDKSSLNEMNLTSVGTCLAIINLNSKGIELDTRKWF